MICNGARTKREQPEADSDRQPGAKLGRAAPARKRDWPLTWVTDLD